MAARTCIQHNIIISLSAIIVTVIIIWISDVFQILIGTIVVNTAIGIVVGSRLKTALSLIFD